MSDTFQTPEAIAYQLMKDIMEMEYNNGTVKKQDRAYWLSTYAECLRKTKGLGDKTDAKKGFFTDSNTQRADAY